MSRNIFLLEGETGIVRKLEVDSGRSANRCSQQQCLRVPSECCDGSAHTQSPQIREQSNTFTPATCASTARSPSSFPGPSPRSSFSHHQFSGGENFLPVQACCALPKGSYSSRNDRARAGRRLERISLRKSRIIVADTDSDRSACMIRGQCKGSMATIPE